MARVRHGISNLVLPKMDLLKATEKKLWDALYKIDPDNTRLELGYQLTPNRAFLLSALGKLMSGNYQKNDGRRELFTSQHQTWAGFRHIAKKGSLLPGKAMAVMPEQHSSVGISNGIAKKVGVMPYVGYAGHKHLGKLVDYSKYTSFSEVGSQIVPEMLAAQNVSNGGRPYQLKEALNEQSIGGLIVGTNHIMRKHDQNDTRLNWERVLDAAQSSGSLILGAHAEYGRSDNSDPDDLGRTMAELRAAADSPEAVGATAMGACLVTAYGIAQEQYSGPEDGFAFDIIHEVTDDALRAEFPGQNPLHVMGDAVDNINAYLTSQFK